MARFDTSFNFGANKRPKKSKKGKKGKAAKGNAWRSYVGGGKKR
jgi:hypothetical protein